MGNKDVSKVFCYLVRGEIKKLLLWINTFVRNFLKYVVRAI